MTGIQRETAPCDCGGTLALKRTLSPWEFHGKCETCRQRITISWAHHAPPPMFVQGETQGVLAL